MMFNYYGCVVVDPIPISAAHGGTESFAGGELSPKRQIYLFLMPIIWQITLYITYRCQMTIFTNILDTCTVKKK